MPTPLCSVMPFARATSSLILWASLVEFWPQLARRPDAAVIRRARLCCMKSGSRQSRGSAGTLPAARGVTSATDDSRRVATLARTTAESSIATSPSNGGFDGSDFSLPQGTARGDGASASKRISAVREDLANVTTAAPPRSSAMGLALGSGALKSKGAAQAHQLARLRCHPTGKNVTVLAIPTLEEAHDVYAVRGSTLGGAATRRTSKSSSRASVRGRSVAE